MASLPSYARILQDGYGEEADFGVLRTSMDNGIAKQRARYSKAIVTRDVQILVLSAADKIALDAWVRDDLHGGAAWFDFFDCLTGKTLQARLVGGKIKWSTPGAVWVASAQIETLG